MPTIAEIIKMDPLELAEKLVKISCVEIPCDINSADDMTRAGNLLGKYTNSYVYLTGVLSFLKVLTKNAKSRGEKELYEDMAMRRDVVEKMAEAEKQKYNAISRMITTKQEVNKELQMAG